MIPLSVPNICGNELRYVTQAISDGWVSTGGPSINKFEDEFACYSGLEYAAACQSGTAALHIALLDAGVGAGDLVLTPVLTFIASVNPIRYVWADPVFLDCDDSLCIDPVKLEDYLRNECELRGDGACYDKSLDRPIKAIIVVHIFGNTADMEGIVSLAKEFNLIIIEDAAEAVGTFFTSGAYSGKMAGAIGDYGIFSLNGNKIITTGGGGVFTSPNSGCVSRMRHLSTQAKTDEIYYTHDAVGYNYRMTNVQAAIGLGQLEQLESFIAKKHANYELYIENGINLLPFRKGIRPNYWFYSYLCDSGGQVATLAGGQNATQTGVQSATQTGVQSASAGGVQIAGRSGGRSGGRGGGADKKLRDKLIRHLYSRGIQTRPIWGLCNEQPMYRNCKAYRIERAHFYYDRVINLPCSTNLTENDVRHVANEIKSFLKKY